MENTIESIHSEAIIIDAHRDCYEQIHRHNMGESTPLHDHMIPRLQKGGVDLVIYAIGGDTLAHSNGSERPLRGVLENMDSYFRETEMENSKVVTVYSSDDLPERPTGKMYYVLSIEGGMPLEGEVATLRMLYRLGLRSIQPTWNVRNELGEGVRERNHGTGLSKFGMQVMEEAQNLGMLVDVSHLSGPGVDDVLSIAKQPIIASHSNAATLFNHPRNLTDARIEGIAKTGGVVGVHFAPAYIHPESNSVEQLVDHIDYMVKLVGIDHVGIGPDFVKSDGPRPAREALYGGVHSRFIDGLEEIDELQTLTRALLERGYSAAEISKIYGANFLRVLKQIL